MNRLEKLKDLKFLLTTLGKSLNECLKLSQEVDFDLSSELYDVDIEVIYLLQELEKEMELENESKNSKN